MSTNHLSARTGEQSEKPDIIVLSNPFKRGDKVRVPAGTEYTSMHPRLNGLQFTKRASTVVLHDISEAIVANSHYQPDKWDITEPVLLTTGTGSYWKRYVLDEKVLAANTIDPTYVTYRYNHGWYELVEAVTA